MASSSKGGALSLDIYYNGYFSLKPLTYHNADMLTTTVDVTPLTFSELKIFVQNNIGSVVTGLYYFSNGLKCIKSDDDLRLFVEKWQSTDEGIIALYVSHNNESLIEYSGDYVLVILNPATYYKDSDDESDVASLDHLSEGEEELRQVRIKERQILDEKKKTNELVVFDESKLLLENESDDNENEHEVDPLFSDLGDESQKDKPHVEPEVNLDEDMPISDEDEIVFDPNKRDYPIHDPNTHWKLKKPRLGELYADLDQVKDCLTFYSVANGYQLWYEKSDSEKLLVRCGFDEKNRRKKKLPRDPNKPCCPFRLRAECQDWTSDICPNIIKVLELHKKIQRKWSLNPSGWHQFEQPEDYVSNSFKVSTYRRIYAFNILPVGGIDMWKKRKHVPMKPPLERRMPGRPTLNRTKDKSEMKNNKHNVLYMLYDDAELVDVQLEQAQTEEMNVDATAVKPDDVIKETTPVNEETSAQVIGDTTAPVVQETTPNVVPANDDEASLKRRYDDYWQAQYNAGYIPPRRTSQRLSMNNYNRKVIQEYAGQGLTPDEAFDVE
ncbi:hypothetical protein CTI12_AA347230 [Artemisia annua]|uniref:Uncharacterized protein n=1 Tax=Artemisia annua TaxID=35608 RepID=A0A2U1MS94_ARTAN|nr:hypothetical protein CTI12_AA347230 [Artemisia annua]